MTTDYPCTKNSKHTQCDLWPEILTVNEQRLFIIERSKNANLVVYDANITQSGTLDPEKPINVYWLSYASSSNPPKEDLNWLEKVKAYGYISERHPNQPNKFIIALKPLPDRKGTLYLDANLKPIAKLPVNGKDALVKKIYVKATETFFVIPTVEYVELFGIDPDTGASVYEKIIP